MIADADDDAARAAIMIRSREGRRSEAELDCRGRRQHSGRCWSARRFSCSLEASMSLRASILVADDDQTSARFLKRWLTKEGHDVEVVHSGGDALEACQSAPPDLVLIDLVVPHGHGFDVCRRLKAESVTRFVPVV